MSESGDNKGGLWGPLFGTVQDLFNKFSLSLIIIGVVVAILGALAQLPWLNLPFPGGGSDFLKTLGVVLIVFGLIAGLISALRRTTDPPIGPVEKFGIKVDSPKDKNVRGDFRIGGKYEKLPENLKLAILEKGGDRHWRTGGVNIGKQDRSWESDLIIRMKKDDETKVKERTFIVVVMGKDGQALYDYIHDVAAQIRENRKRLSLPPEAINIPGCKTLTSDMVECARVTVVEV